MDTEERTELEESFDINGQSEVVGVKFKDNGKVYYFAPEGVDVCVGDPVIVKTARGTEFGYAAQSNKTVSNKEIVPPLRPLVRLATKEDIARCEENKKLSRDAFRVCLEKIREHKLDMKLVDAEYTFDNSKLLFYFSADGRVDFRELVRDLAGIFRTRIELRQIGIRDEAKMMGGLGVCGRPFCCTSFLSDFVQVSIKMAKEQNLSLNSSKISGTCGRLMCCLRYENETYEREMKITPPVGAHVKTTDGAGTVLEANPLTGMLKVAVAEKNGEHTKSFHRDDVTLIDRGKPKNDQNAAK